jgi:hypothetical protein
LLHPLLEFIQKARLMPLEPIEQGTAVVERYPKGGVFFEQIKKGPVAALIGLPEYMVKVSHRLMVVNAQKQMDLSHYTLHIFSSKSSSGTVNGM